MPLYGIYKPRQSRFRRGRRPGLCSIEMLAGAVGENAQPFEAHRGGVEGGVDAAVGGLHVVAPGGAESGDWATAGAPVPPRAVAATLLLLDRHVPHANRVGANERQRV